MRYVAKSSKSAQYGGKGAFAKSMTCPDSTSREENPPAYGAQQRQDACWKGGNEALPPSWQQFKTGDGKTLYQDDNLFMVTWERPLPGVRLDEPGDFHISTWEWHISPSGRSYFVNHKTRTTSWNRPKKEHATGNTTSHCIIEGPSEPVWSLVCVGTSVISALGNGSIRLWTQKGKAIGQPWCSDGGVVKSLAASPDGTLVVSGGVDGRIRLWNIKEGRIIGKPWEGHNAAVRCLDWSPTGQEIVSGSLDGTIQRWNPDNGRHIASPIETGQCWLYTIKYSPQGDKFASSASDGKIRVWSKDGELILEIKQDNWAMSLCWSKDGTCIFSGSTDSNVRKWRLIDGIPVTASELVVFRGHTYPIQSLCLSIDGCHLMSASEDRSVRIWDLRNDQLVGEPLLHDNEVLTLAMSPDGKYMASAGLDKRIYLWDVEAALKRGGHQSALDGSAQSSAKLKECVPSPGDILDVSTKSKQPVTENDSARYENNFWGVDTNHTPHGSAPPTSLPRRRNLFDFLGLGRLTVGSSPIQPRPRRWGFSLFTSSRTVDVPAAQDTNRYYIAPPTEAEVAMAMQALNGSTQQLEDKLQDTAEVQARVVPKQNSVPGNEPSYVVRCCGFVVHRVRSSST